MSKSIVVYIFVFNKTKESWEMNSDEKLEQSCIVKEKGTQYFKVSIYTFSRFYEWRGWFFTLCVCLFQEGKYKQAALQYKKIISWLEHESGLSEEDEKKAKALQLAAHLNLAMCFLKLNEPNKALENCDKVSLLGRPWAAWEGMRWECGPG